MGPTATTTEPKARTTPAAGAARNLSKPGARPLPEGLALKIFIVGAPRSGTSIMLRAMKDVLGLPGFGESHAIPVFQSLVQTLRTELAKFDQKDQSLMAQLIPADELEQHLGEFVRKFYHNVYTAGSWVDKSARGRAVSGLPMIESIFPDARLIMIKRNGIEVVVSHLKKFEGSSFSHACRTWTQAMRGLLKARNRCRNLLEIDQYDLQNATEQVSQQIATHVGLPDRADDLAKFFTNQRVQGSSTHDQKKRVRLSDTSWSNAEKNAFRQACGPTMERFGYEM